MSCRGFYWQWLCKAFPWPWSIVQVLSFIAASVFGALAWKYPQWGGTLSILVWALPLGVFTATTLVGFILAPYYINKDTGKDKIKLAKELEDVIAKLPFIVTDLQKDSAGTEFYLEVKNTGGEATFDAEIRVLEGDLHLRRDQRLSAYWERGGKESLLGKNQTDRIRVGAVVSESMGGLGMGFNNLLYFYDRQNLGLANIVSDCTYLVLHGVTPPDALVNAKPKWNIQFIISSHPSMKDGVVSRSFEFELGRFEEKVN